VLNWELPAFIRYSASLSYAFMEWLAGFIFDGIVAATPKIAQRFPPKKDRSSAKLSGAGGAEN